MMKREYELLQGCLRDLRETQTRIESCVQRVAGLLYTAATTATTTTIGSRDVSCGLEWACEDCRYYYRGECALCVRKEQKEVPYENGS